MAHQVSFTVPARPVGNKDIEFDVKRNNAMFGTLKVSQGGVVWRPEGSHFGYFLNWNRLNQVVEQNHTRRRAL